MSVAPCEGMFVLFVLFKKCKISIKNIVKKKKLSIMGMTPLPPNDSREKAVNAGNHELFGFARINS